MIEAVGNGFVGSFICVAVQDICLMQVKLVARAGKSKLVVEGEASARDSLEIKEKSTEGRR